MNGADLCPQCGKRMDHHGLRKMDGLLCEYRDLSDLTPQLIGLEGYRVEVEDPDDGPYRGLTRRFYVGRSTGWKPCHLEIHNRRSRGGGPALKEYASVRALYRR